MFLSNQESGLYLEPAQPQPQEKNLITKEIFRSAVIAAQHLYSDEGVTQEDLAALIGAPLPVVEQLFNDSNFRLACRERGHPVEGNTPLKIEELSLDNEELSETVLSEKLSLDKLLSETVLSETVLSEKLSETVPKKTSTGISRTRLSDRQILALHYIVQDTTTPSLAGRLRHAGVTIKEYNQWRKSAAFRAELKKLGQTVLEDSEQDMLTTLAGLAVNGDQKAIEFAFELTGKHNPRAQEAINVALVLQQVLEAIKDEVRDPDTLRRLSSRIALAATSLRTSINSSSGLDTGFELNTGFELDTGFELKANEPALIESSAITLELNPD